MIEVRIRWDGDSVARHLTEVPFDKIDTVLPAIKAWGVDGEEPEMYGQFSVEERAAYYEVVLVATGE